MQNLKGDIARDREGSGEKGHLDISGLLLVGGHPGNANIGLCILEKFFVPPKRGFV